MPTVRLTVFQLSFLMLVHHLIGVCFPHTNRDTHTLTGECDKRVSSQE